MPTRPRKKYQLRYRNTADVDSFPSERKAYEFIQTLARSYLADPKSMDPHVVVWLDEGDGRWQRYDEVDLAELATVIAADSNR